VQRKAGWRESLPLKADCLDILSVKEIAKLQSAKEILRKMKLGLKANDGEDLRRSSLLTTFV